MKRILLLLVLCVTAMVSTAQNGWQPITIDGDELKGTESYVVYNYNTGDGILGFYENTGIIVIMTDKGIFDYDSDDYAKGVVIGLYDKNEKLVEKVQTPTQRTFHVANRGHSAFCVRDDVNAKLVEYIKNNNGYVRIVVDRWERGDFDIKVPCMQ